MLPCQLLQNGIDYQYLNDKEQKRKLSYDEDVYDYELSDDNDHDDAVDDHSDGVNDKSGMEEEFDAKEAYLQLKRYAAKQRKSKDVTPESDYASENNYPLNAQDEKEANISDEDNMNDDDTCDMFKQFNLSVLKTPSGHSSKDESETEEVDEEEDYVASISDDEDFLTTTFTWNLRNKPKLEIDGRDKVVSNTHETDDNNSVEQQKSVDTKQEKICMDKVGEKSAEIKLDKLERCWPWADREKIIYKQSTCHLVPHKPLGLIEQRIQLLAKRNLLEHFNRTTNPQ